MKLAWGAGLNDLFSIWVDEVGRWDGYPQIQEFFVHGTPIGVSNDRAAVAATLLFGDHFGGVVDFGHDVNLVTANAIRRYCSPVDVFVSRIDEGPKPIAHGGGVLDIADFPSVDWTRITSAPFLTRTLVLASSAEYKGSLAWQRGRLTTTNAWCFDSDSSSPRPRRVGALAAAVLYSAELEVGRIRLGAEVGGEDLGFDRWFAKAQDLLQSVGIGLEGCAPMGGAGG